jgi:hypothetical protein
MSPLDQNRGWKQTQGRTTTPNGDIKSQFLSRITSRETRVPVAWDSSIRKEVFHSPKKTAEKKGTRSRIEIKRRDEFIFLPERNPGCHFSLM